MADSGKNKKDECQLEFVYEAGLKPTFFDRIRNMGLRLMSAIRRRTNKDKYGPIGDYSGGPGVGLGGDDSGADNSGMGLSDNLSFSPGEIVRIKSVAEIQKTLDNKGRCGGLQFMAGMRKYCGQEARVLKKVRTIFDERLWKMVKIKDAYLLENITCDGRDVFDGEGCDRTCYFFWKSRWLTKKNQNQS
jgi:hypothetical protein